MKSVVLFFICFFSFLNATEKEYIIMGCRPDAGLFSIFQDVLALLKYYEKGNYKGIEVYFGKNGLYYSPEHGDDWWSYYYEPICLGEKINVRHVMGSPPGAIDGEIENLTAIDEVKKLIDKYIKIKPEIMKKIERFEFDNFTGNYVIAVHYRGTDKIIKAPRV